MLLVATLLASADAWGKKKEKDGAAALRDELEAQEETVKAQADALGGARDYELENMARHRAGELNEAELGMANMQHALNDPSAMWLQRDSTAQPSDLESGAQHHLS